MAKICHIYCNGGFDMSRVGGGGGGGGCIQDKKDNAASRVYHEISSNHGIDNSCLLHYIIKAEWLVYVPVEYAIFASDDDLASSHYRNWYNHTVNWTHRNNPRANIIAIQTFSLKKMRFKISSAKFFLYVPVLGVLYVPKATDMPWEFATINHRLLQNSSRLSVSYN